MNFKKLTILSLVFLMSGVVSLFVTENLFAWENPKRFRESREILKILQFQKELKKNNVAESVERSSRSTMGSTDDSFLS